MTKYLPWIGAGVLGFLLLAMPQCAPSGGWQADTAAKMAEVRAREAQADAKLRAADSALGVANRRTALAEHTDRLSRERLASANSLRDSVLALGVAPDTCAPWVDLLRREADSLRSAVALAQTSYDTLHASWVTLRLANAALAASDSLSRASVDSLVALVRRTPTRKWWMPEAQGGYGAVVSEGAIRAGPGVNVGWNIKF